MKRPSSVAVSLWAAAIALTGCESLAVTAFGVGASAGVTQAINGTIDRTFTYPVKNVRNATLAALKAMAVTVEPGRAGTSGPIQAHAQGRDIQIDFEELSANSTRMRVIAQSSNWFFYDAATGREIVAQTEKALATAARPTEAGSSVPMQGKVTAEAHPVRLESAPTLLSPSP